VAKLNQEQRNFRIFGPDETLFESPGAVFEVTNRHWDAGEVKDDEFLAPAGRVLDSMLSEHQCEGWLEGYLLTGHHGLFNSYEAFIRIVDSMFSQHAKWLKVTSELPIIFGFRGYPWLVHRLTYRQTNRTCTSATITKRARSPRLST
jgi:xylulose-5-phosphate/fructose-6-phosphate phosphoketolase